jgi:prepilin-type N-terminal cleavage/methylation domain-containing protein
MRRTPSFMLPAARKSSAPHFVHRSRRPGARGFTQLELLVVVAILVVLAGILLPAVAKVRRTARSVNCISNLRQINLAFQRHATDQGGRLPDPLAADKPWEGILLSYVGASGVYRCPSDDELADVLGSSYDWRDTGDPATTLAGAQLTDVKSDTVIVYDSLPGWHATGKMNAARGDGSALSMDATECLTNLMTPLRKLPQP